MNRLLLLSISLALLASCTSGKHLFILSGQSNMARLNPEQSFTPWVEEAFGKDGVIVVKQAKGAQPIHRWFKAWAPPEGEVPELRGALYDTLMAAVVDSIRGQRIRTVTFIWMQGERDARMQWGEVYEASLLGLYQQLSEDLGRTDVNFVIGRLSDFDLRNEKWPHWTRVREAQVKVANAHPHFDWVDTDDLNDGVDAKGVSIENDLHMSAKGYDLLGKRFAEKAIQFIRAHD